MTGIREKKKEQTRKKIQTVSMQLFEALGYEKTTMERIASEAEIGLGTLYNYYSSKTTLFFSMIEGNIEPLIYDLEQVISKEMTLRESLDEFYNIYMKSFTLYGKNIWRDLLREVLFGEHMGYEKIKEIDQNFIDQLCRLIIMRTGGEETNKSEQSFIAAKSLYSLLEYHIIYYVSDSSVSMQKMKESLMQQASLLVDGLARKEIYH